MEERKHIVILAAGDFPTHPVPLRALREADFVVCCDSAYNEFHRHIPLSPSDSSPVSGEQHKKGLLDPSSALPLTQGEYPKGGRGYISTTKKNEELRMKNYVVIGDGDSLSDEDKRQLGDRWVHVPEQDYNDLHKAMDYATSHFPPPTSHFTLLGATGKREDHTLGNISYLVTFTEEHPGADIEMLTDYGRFIALGPSPSTSHLSPFSISPFSFTLPSFPGQQVSIFSMDPNTRISSEGLRWPLDGFRARRWWQATLNEALGDSFTLTTDGWLVVFQTYEAKR